MRKKSTYPAAFVLVPGLSAGAANTNIASGLLGYYPLNEVAGDIAYDMSGNGHSEYFKWKDPRTISYGMLEVGSDPSQTGNPDLHRVQKAVWSELGYTASSW